MNKKHKLKKRLRKCEKLRDEWCAEYTRTRNKLRALKRIYRSHP